MKIYYFLKTNLKLFFKFCSFASTVDCKQLKETSLLFFFQIKEATNINSLFWLGFGLGRLAGMLFFKYFKPSTIIIFDLVGTIALMIAMCVAGEQLVPISWVVTALYSFLQGTIYPGGVSWSSQFVNMSGNYIFVFSAGQALGTMIIVPVSGIIFDYNPFNVMYVVLGCSILNGIIFLIMLVEGSRLSKKLILNEELPKEVETEIKSDTKKDPCKSRL